MVTYFKIFLFKIIERTYFHKKVTSKIIPFSSGDLNCRSVFFFFHFKISFSYNIKHTDDFRVIFKIYCFASGSKLQGWNITMVLHVLVFKVTIHLGKLSVCYLILQFSLICNSFPCCFSFRNSLWESVFQLKNTMVKINIKFKGSKFKSLRVWIYFCS